MKKKKFSWSILIMAVGCFVGLSMLLYPAVSNHRNDTHATHIMQDYGSAVQQMEDVENKELWDAAMQFNAELNQRDNVFALTPELAERYTQCLRLDGSGIMGYVDIPKINVQLPIYHGTEDSALQLGVGHMEWTSLPVGGESTHSVLSGHRGLLSSKMLIDLDQLKEGDSFRLHILDETLCYEVDQIRTVEPDEVKDLTVTEGKDYCTLVTCTPHGVNTHRLLVRGHRVENTDGGGKVVSEAVIVNRALVAVLLSAPLLLILLLLVLFRKPKKKKATADDIFTSE